MTEEINIIEDYLYALAASPDFQNDSTLFAARSSGLYCSTDQGHSWFLAYDSLGLDSSLPTTAVAFSPDFRNDQTVFAAVEGNVLRSTDGGGTWAYVELAKPAPLVSTLGISPQFAEDGLLLAGTLDDGIIRSTNRSANWYRWNFGLLDPHIYALTFAPDGVVLTGVESGIFRSTNGGRAWREVDFPMDLAPVVSLATMGEILFAGTEQSGLHISKDNGITWQQIAPERIQGAVNQILVDGSKVLAVLDESTYFSEDEGASWGLMPGFETISTISSVAAPLGLNQGNPLWLGLSNGEVIRIDNN